MEKIWKIMPGGCVENTPFVIDQHAERVDCPKCNGTGVQGVRGADGEWNPLGAYTTSSTFPAVGGAGLSLGVEEVSAPDETPVGGQPCYDQNCYGGHVLTPYEKEVQQIIYKLHTEARCAIQRIETFENVDLKTRLGFAWGGKINARLLDLGGRPYLIRDGQNTYTVT